MQETPLKISQSLTSEQKRAVLEAVLHSQTFSRADQLKCLLKYVCEMEMAGRDRELTEYLIGIEALGRPANYSPGDDSAVRTRAFALRKKLQEFYGHEQPNAALRIELRKGSYCSHFVESQPQQEVNIDGTPAESVSAIGAMSFRLQSFRNEAKCMRKRRTAAAVIPLSLRWH